MLVVEQTLTCDVCGAEMQSLRQSIRPNEVVQVVDRYQGVSGWRDVCGDCFGLLTKAFWAIKTAKDAE